MDQRVSRPDGLYLSSIFNDFDELSIYGSQSTPTDALSSLLDPFSSPVSDTTNTNQQNQQNGLTISQLTGVPYKQMPVNRFVSQTGRRTYGLMTSPAGLENNINPMGAPGTPLGSLSSPMVASPTAGNGTAPPPKNPKLYKTELCRSWMDQGRCNYGERCQYAHGEAEKRPIPRHPKYKTEACQSFHQTGYCPYGPRCHFIHNETELLANLSTATQQRPSSGLPLGTIGTFTTSSPSLSGSCRVNSSMSGSMGNYFATSSGPGGPGMTPGSLAPVANSLLQRMTSLPNYGSTGESPSGSSADSGSESPNGSFSPGLELEEAGPFTSGFMSPLRRQSQPAKLPSSSLFAQTANKDQQQQNLNFLIGDILSWSLDDQKWEQENGRLPVFTSLSNQQ